MKRRQGQTSIVSRFAGKDVTMVTATEAGEFEKL